MASRGRDGGTRYLVVAGTEGALPRPEPLDRLEPVITGSGFRVYALDPPVPDDSDR